MSTKTALKGRILLLPMLLFISSTLFSQPQNQEEMMKAWSAYMTPGDMHAALAKMDGDWNTEISLWMDPSGQPMKSKGSCTNKMVLGGRYQQSQFKGDFMGQPMEGIGTTGYDNTKKVYESTWIDNLGTGIMKMQGNYDPSSKTFSFTGAQTDFTSGKDMPVREVLKIVDDKTHVMEMFITPPGMSEFKSMEIKFTRK